MSDETMERKNELYDGAPDKPANPMLLPILLLLFSISCSMWKHEWRQQR